METNEGQRLREAMLSPAFYEQEVDTVEHKQTHISDVYLVGELVYKVKKSVDTGFLDFTTLEKRLLFCRREVELNRRLSRNIYLGLVDIRRQESGFRLGGSGEIVEYAVLMKRLDYGDTLESKLKHGVDVTAFLSKVTDVLVDFYRHSATGEKIDKCGTREAILANCRGNFKQIGDEFGELIDTEKLQLIASATEAFARRHQRLFERRVEQGRICDTHGDLKTEHIYKHQGVQILDCIEFNDHFRYQDPAADLAFLAMDMDFLGHSSQAVHFLSEYVHRQEDHELMRLIDFYKCYRAMVQVKVRLLQYTTEAAKERRQESLENIERYLDLAYGYGVKMVRPVLWVICGLTATGKSTIAEKLSRLLSLPRLSSDGIRAALFEENKHREDFGQGVYSATATSLVYAKMLVLAAEELEAGRSVLLDATYRQSSRRSDVLELARNRQVSVIFVECRCDEEEVERRLRQREEEPGLSDARIEHWQKIKETADDLDDISAEMHIPLQTHRPLGQCLEEILMNMDRLLALQVEKSVAMTFKKSHCGKKGVRIE